jgi:uncharacterized protein YjbK
MSKQVEIEFKTLLTQAEHQKVIAFYQLTSSDFHTQTNLYFDTADQQLKQNKFGLRIRMTSDKAELTLKTPLKEGLLETTDLLSIKEATDLKDKQMILQKGAVADRLMAEQIDPASLKPFAELTTRRAEFPISEGLLALDESWYGQCHDYELELEVAEASSGKQAFFTLLDKLGIVYQPAKNKIVRALEEMSNRK